jgi:hypothetical protein
MSRPIYVPIADSFFESSIMHEDVTTRFVMLALIRLGLRSGANGVIDIDPRIFAQSINIPYADVEVAIDRLMQPDPASSSPEEDGRRIVPVDPARPQRNWRLVNWDRYRTIVHRAADAARKREERAHAAESTMDMSRSVQTSPSQSLKSENGATNTNTKTRTKTTTKTLSTREKEPLTDESRVIGTSDLQAIGSKLFSKETR